jgi:hypothetical protein
MRETTEQVSSHPGENGGWEPKKGIETALRQRITGTDWEKVLANRSNRK